MEQLCYYVLTGSMGGGKSTIINHLLQKKIICIPEPAREILMEQRNINADGIPEKDTNLFTKLMLSRATNNYKRHYDSIMPVIFDRAIPDMIAYADLFQLNKEIYYNASKYYKYNNTVFLFKGWKEIYTTDNERKMNFEQANDFGNRTEEIYRELGYNIITVPQINIEERIKFIENIILAKKIKE
jgi:predicted ATPase